MKILHIIPNLRQGGAERLVIDIVQELSKREGVDVRLVLLKNEIDYIVEPIKELILVRSASVQLSLWKKNKIFTQALQSFINDFKPDIIHSHLFEAEIVSRSCYYPHAKWFSHCHDNIIQFENLGVNTFKNKSTLTNYVEKKYLFKQYKINRGTHFIAISNHAKTFFENRISNYSITLLNNAINYSKFFREREQSIGSKKIKLINIGSFVEKKNQQLLIQIADLLYQRGVDFEVHFLGDGILCKTLEEKSKQLGLEKHVIFHGNVNNVEELLANSDIYIHVAKYEPLGLVLIEAMASGLPVVTLDGGGNRDLIEEGENGFMIYDENPILFVEKTLHLKENPDTYQKISVYAQKFAQKFDIKSYVSKLLKIYSA